MHPSAGGPPTVIQRLCSQAPLHGLDATVITTSLYCDDDGQELRKLLGHIDVNVLPIRSPKILKRAWGDAKAITTAVSCADIVHLHTLWNPLNTMARKVCQRLRRKYILMPHGMLDPYSLHQKAWRKKLYFAAADRKTIEHASRMLFTTTLEEKSARESIPWLGVSAVVPLAADEFPDHLTSSSIEKFRRGFPQTTKRRCLLFLGRIHPKKGLEILLKILPRIVRNHTTVLLIIAGDGEPVYVQNVRSLVQSLDLESHVLFTGRISGCEKWGALACAEIFILPSSQENFAISVAESMHAGVPVIISNRVDSWPFVQEAEAGFVIDLAQLEAALPQRIDALLRTPEQARSLGNNGRKFARRYFSWERVNREMAALYSQVLSE